VALQFAMFAIGLVVLAAGAEVLVRGGVKLARIFGLSPLLVGLTILAYGTSLPELVVSVLAALKGSAAIALGNAIGSNLLNTGLILGLAAWLFPVIATRDLLRRDLPLHLLVATGFSFLVWDGKVSHLDGALLLVAMLGYLIHTVWVGVKHPEIVPDLPDSIDEPPPNERWWVALLMILAGSVGLYFGANWMVNAAVFIAHEMGVSERVVGITIVALGTSLPELATTVAAARKHESGLVIGNLVGSNIFNLMLIVGSAGVIAPFTFSAADVHIDLAFLLLNAVALFVLFGRRRPHQIGRWDAFALLLMYLGFLGALFYRVS
jgi:cation:H+ antiporter